MRYVLSTAVEKLPSIDVRSFQAVHGLGGRPGWTQKSLTRDVSGISGAEKLALLRACHEDMSHLGGREGLVAALRKEGKSWVNMDLDATWVLRHCERCLSHTCRETVKSTPRSLPRPIVAGSVVLSKRTLKSIVKGALWAPLCIVQHQVLRGICPIPGPPQGTFSALISNWCDLRPAIAGCCFFSWTLRRTRYSIL